MPDTRISRLPQQPTQTDDAEVALAVDTGGTPPKQTRRQRVGDMLSDRAKRDLSNVPDESVDQDMLADALDRKVEASAVAGTLARGPDGAITLDAHSGLPAARGSIEGALLPAARPGPNSPDEGKVASPNASGVWQLRDELGGDTSRLDPEASKPSPSGVAVGTIENIAGEPYEVVASGDKRNVLSGIATATGMPAGYIGFEDNDNRIRWKAAGGLPNPVILEGSRVDIGSTIPTDFHLTAHDLTGGGWWQAYLDRLASADTATYRGYGGGSENWREDADTGIQVGSHVVVECVSTDAAGTPTAPPANLHPVETRWVPLAARWLATAAAAAASAAYGRLKSILVAGSNITLDAVDAAKTITINGEAGGGGGVVPGAVASAYDYTAGDLGLARQDAAQWTELAAVTITPTSPSSKVRLAFSGSARKQAGAAAGNFVPNLRLTRQISGGAETTVQDRYRAAGSSDVNDFDAIGVVFEDAPNTAAAVTYRMRASYGTTGGQNRPGAVGDRALLAETTGEGAQATVRGDLWATSVTLPTAAYTPFGQNLTRSAGTAFEVSPAGAAAGVVGRGAGGRLQLSLPGSPPSHVIGLWAAAEVDGVEVASVYIPWSAGLSRLEGTPPSVFDDAANLTTRVGLRCSTDNPAAFVMIAMRFNAAGVAQLRIFSMATTGDQALTPPRPGPIIANTKIKVYAAAARGAVGPAGRDATADDDALPTALPRAAQSERVAPSRQAVSNLIDATARDGAAAWGPTTSLDAAANEAAVGDGGFYRKSDTALAFQIAGVLARNALLSAAGLLIDGSVYRAAVTPLGAGIAHKRRTVSGASGTITAIAQAGAGVLRFTASNIGDLVVGQSVRFDGVAQGSTFLDDAYRVIAKGVGTFDVRKGGAVPTTTQGRWTQLTAGPIIPNSNHAITALTRVAALEPSVAGWRITMADASEFGLGDLVSFEGVTGLAGVYPVRAVSGTTISVADPVAAAASATGHSTRLEAHVEPDLPATLNGTIGLAWPDEIVTRRGAAAGAGGQVDPERHGRIVSVWGAFANRAAAIASPPPGQMENAGYNLGGSPGAWRRSPAEVTVGAGQQLIRATAWQAPTIGSDTGWTAGAWDYRRADGPGTEWSADGVAWHTGRLANDVWQRDHDPVTGQPNAPVRVVVEADLDWIQLVEATIYRATNSVDVSHDFPAPVDLAALRELQFDIELRNAAGTAQTHRFPYIVPSNMGVRPHANGFSAPSEADGVMLSIQGTPTTQCFLIGDASLPLVAGASDDRFSQFGLVGMFRAGPTDTGRTASNFAVLFTSYIQQHMRMRIFGR